MRGSLSFAVPGANSHTSLYARDVVFVDGKPTEIPTGSTLIPTDRGNFAEIYENDAITIGRLHDGLFTDGGRAVTMGQNQGIPYAFARTAATRPEKRRVGKACVGTCKLWRSQTPKKKKK